MYIIKVALIGPSSSLGNVFLILKIQFQDIKNYIFIRTNRLHHTCQVSRFFFFGGGGSPDFVPRLPLAQSPPPGRRRNLRIFDRVAKFLHTCTRPIMIRFRRYRYEISFVDINTSTLWRYRNDIDTYFDGIVDIKRCRQGFVNIDISTVWRYRQISSISSRYRQSYVDIDTSTLTIFSMRFRWYRY